MTSRKVKLILGIWKHLMNCLFLVLKTDILQGNFAKDARLNVPAFAGIHVEFISYELRSQFPELNSRKPAGSHKCFFSLHHNYRVKISAFKVWGSNKDNTSACSLEASHIRFLNLCVICDHTPPMLSSSVKDHPMVCSVNYRSFDVIEHSPVEIDYTLS